MATTTQKYRQSPDEIKFYSNDYTKWLAQGETVVSAAVKIDNVTSPALNVVAAVINNGLGIKYTVLGGVHGQTYRVGIEATTNLGQLKEDMTIFVLIDPLQPADTA